MQMIPGADDVIVNEAEVVASGTGWDIDSLNSIEGIVKAEMRRIARTKRWERFELEAFRRRERSGSLLPKS
jgi:hypothetical protein